MDTGSDLGLRPHEERRWSFVLSAKAAWDAKYSVKTRLDALRRSQAFWDTIRPIIETDGERDARVARARHGELRALLAAIQDRMAELRASYLVERESSLLIELRDLREEAAGIRAELAAME